jgi:hypothetical protein
VARPRRFLQRRRRQGAVSLPFSAVAARGNPAQWPPRMCASQRANATVIADTTRPKSAGWSTAEVRMELDIEDAVFDQAPLRAREG